MEKLLNKKQVADILGYSVPGITKMVMENRIPYIKMADLKSAAVRFDPAEIRRWLQSSTRNAAGGNE